MKKIILTLSAFLALLRVSAQSPDDSTGFVSRKLRIDEVNFISSYYHQTGEHASVTGGMGSEALTDLANVLDVSLVTYDKKLRKNTFGIEMGIDNYTSASSDMIDLQANSSASHADTRLYPSLSWTVENEKKGRSFTVGAAISSEFDYKSYGANISFSKKTKKGDGTFVATFQTYLDQVKLVLPIELRTKGQSDDATSPRNTFSGSFSYSQIINERFQVMVLADLVQQNGYLSLPFHRVYFNDYSVHQEKLPNSRFKLPVGIYGSYFLLDRIILKGYYRYYTDNWGLRSQTASLEVPVKITPFFSVSPFFRYYDQTGVRYFAPFGKHAVQDPFYTSNYDLSTFQSNFFGLNVRYAPPKGVLGLKYFTMFELRYGHYIRSDGLAANIITVNLKFR